MLYANYNTTHTFNRSAAKSQKPSETKAKKTTKTKSQESSEAKAKSQMGMQIGSKLQQIARKSEILAPAANTSQKPETEGARSQKPKARSQKPKKNAQKNTPPYINPKIDPYLSVPLSALS